MKLIKKIAAIMFAFMMVVSMSCNVKADDTTTAVTGETGTITINNAILGQTYKIYKILELESYNPTTENYAYKVTAEWKSFIEDEGKDYLKKVDGTDYVNWVGDSSNNGEHVKTFAEKAIAYAKDVNNNINPLQTNENVTSNTVTFNNLPLGYYLVDSSVGTLCSLDTTKPNVDIKEKNGVPSVEKEVSNTQNGTFGESSTASIGDKVYFKTTITTQPGAQNYVLHDKMTEGLTFDKNSVNVSLHKNATNTNQDLFMTTDYSVETTNLERTDPKCTFHINFTKELCDRLEANDTITVAYSATLNDKAVIGNNENTNTNKTLLSYGDSQKTTEVTTNTKTFKMDVFKYTENRNDKTKKDGLAGAVFTLRKEGETNTINFEKETTDETNGDVYHVAKTDDANITTNKSGKFTIKGLGAGTYYLTETKQPDGYNKLAKPVKVEIKDNGEIFVDDSKTANIGDVKVENKTGTVLPSTGGMGTTMIYLIGALLVLGSGVVLATKRRVKNK